MADRHVTTPPSLEVQAANLAAFFAEVTHELWRKVATKRAYGVTEFDRTGESTFVMTTRSGTKLQLKITVLDAGE